MKRLIAGGFRTFKHIQVEFLSGNGTCDVTRSGLDQTPVGRDHGNAGGRAGQDGDSIILALRFVCCKVSKIAVLISAHHTGGRGLVSLCTFSLSGPVRPPFRLPLFILHYRRYAARLQDLFQLFREKDGIDAHPKRNALPGSRARQLPVAVATCWVANVGVSQGEQSAADGLSGTCCRPTKEEKNNRKEKHVEKRNKRLSTRQRGRCDPGRAQVAAEAPHILLPDDDRELLLVELCKVPDGGNPVFLKSLHMVDAEALKVHEREALPFMRIEQPGVDGIARLHAAALEGGSRVFREE
jgi:hypothetical protein